MYEEKERRKLQINWKSLLIKLGILLVVIFVVIWIVSLFNKDKEVVSNFGVNLQSMREAATEYFTGSRLPSEINESTSLTLGEMFERNLLIEFQDENGNSCDTENSYVEATKLDDENYRIEVRLVCDNDSDTIINTVKYQSQDNNQDIDDDPIIDDNDEENDSNDVNSGTNNNQGNSNNNSQNTSNNSSNSSKPNTGQSGNNSNNNSSNNNNSTSNNSGNNNNNSNSNNNTVATSCSYGKKEYVTVYPLAYVVSGDCAVSSSSISGSHANNATRIGNSEYKKLVEEMQALENKTGVELVVSTPEYSKILNKTGNGYVGYQIYFSVKQKISTYAGKTIYSYYLDQNGNRKVIIDSRNSLGSSNSGSSNISVTSITLNRSSLTLDIGDTYTLVATVSPSNATNKTVTWSSSNTSVATVSSSGKVTAKKAGTATITAKAGSKSATVKVTVNEEEIAVTKVEINRSSLTLDIGDTYILKATVSPSNATDDTVTWSSSNTSVATVTSSGKVTAKKAGTVTITAKAGTKKDTVTVTVEKEVETIKRTYYLMSYVSDSYVGKSYIQDFIFKDIDRNDASILNISVDYYNGIRDFNNYVNTKNESKDIELYSGYAQEGYLQMIGASDLYYSALDASNFTFTNTSVKYLGGYYGVRITTYIKNVNYVPKYSNSYFVPLKVTVTYEQ